ncbi:TIGR00270 family protein [Candidatus Woesearchaeota archaeon]|jgi:putative transcription factor|nr:TIGR00270 family protein [Candidatus Woesearchaeota archaeon]MBT4368819.1 TIGR00270 family protein [Candidatus Woesearchaeota archaeon]MBT4712108.1 TIGR00270 family protein [Candidatus Woesearchaeota archaeon]MBT6639144.1 TIGR00270 family protein [Candidatus Woesearchaeota archaeon]MBT7134344.1 TIGR00270 family protein [Candidatus Woesearchaeota archaeon]
MECDMCGSSEQLFKTQVEGSMLTVCSQCAKHGTVISRVKTEEEVQRETKRVNRKVVVEDEPVETIVTNYSSLIKKARESKNMTQEEVAKKINEKESVLHHAENAEGSLSIALARKLERFLGIKLVEFESYEYEPEKQAESGALTIGDMIKK